MFYLYLAILFTDPSTGQQQFMPSEEKRGYPSMAQCKLMGDALSISLKLPPGFTLKYRCIEVTGSIEGHPLTPEQEV